ncbi:MAG: choice-of-anchor D domain-containing protein, partial [Bacteroidota bacterium]|nr:choice-of-anchor D domain-containing protein [Candidatus Kapabacteria bacterium]MDW8221261.1 choice-of-anchor D domain-containing protein [Bacteroidota bacterium]
MMLSGAHATDFRVLSPSMLPANIPVTGRDIVIQFDGSALGVRTAVLRVVVVDSAGNPTIEDLILNLRGTRQRRSFELLQQTLDFGTLPPNMSAIRTISWLRNTGTVPIVWDYVVNFHPLFRIVSTVPASTFNPVTRRASATLQPGDTMRLTVEFLGDVAGQVPSANFNPTDIECAISLDFQVRASVAQNPPNITVRRRTQGTEVPVRDQRLYLGDYACEATKPPYVDTTLTIYNSGQEMLIVTGATFDHPDFQIVNPPELSSQNPLRITFNTSRDITIRYTPRQVSEQDFLPTLTLFSNARNGFPVGSTTVNLRVRNDLVRLEVSRQSIVFGTVTRGGTLPPQTLVLRNRGTVVQPVPPLNSQLFEALIPQPVLSPGDSVVVTIRVRSTATAGVFSDVWNIRDLCGIELPVLLQYTVNRPNPTLGLAVPVRFGSLVCTSDTIHTVTITNTGDDANDLVISEMHILGTSGGAFTFVQTPVLPVSLASGQSRTIQIRFRPLRTGAATDTLRIVSNADGMPVFHATLVGSKDSVGFTISRTSVSFINILPNASASEVLTITNTGTLPITWGAGNARVNAPFSLQVTPVTTPPGGTSQAVITFLGGANDVSGRIELIDNCSQVRTIAVQATILPPYISATHTLSLGTLTCETSSSSQITLTNTGGQDLVISAITSSSPLYRVQVSTLPVRLVRGMSATVPIVFVPLPTTQGIVNATLTITSNAANGVTTTTVSAVKNVLDFEFLDLSATDEPTTIFRSLGAAPPNTARTLDVRLRNAGNLPIVWQMPVYSFDSLFIVERVSPNPTPAGAVATMTLRYRGSACPGQYLTSMGLPVLERYGFDCRKPTARVVLSAETLPATAQLWTNDVRAVIGDTFFVPIRIRRPQYMQEAGVQGFSCVLRYH